MISVTLESDRLIDVAGVTVLISYSDLKFKNLK